MSSKNIREAYDRKLSKLVSLSTANMSPETRKAHAKLVTEINDLRAQLDRIGDSPEVRDVNRIRTEETERLPAISVMAILAA